MDSRELESSMSPFKIFSIEGMDGEVAVVFFLIFVTSIAFLSKVLGCFKEYLENSTRLEDRALIAHPPQPSYNRPEEPCPVCYSSINFAVETDCLHIFCGTCILALCQYARHRNITCPVCRAQVLMLYPVFTVDEFNLNRTDDLGLQRDNVISEIREYNHLFSGGNRTILQVIYELPVYVRRIWRSFNNPNDVIVPNRTKILLYIVLFLCAFYIIFPFDLLSEVHFGILGFLDDFLVLSLSLMYMTSVFRTLFIDLEHL